MRYVVAFLLLGSIFAIIDAIWLKCTSGFYKKHLGALLRDKPNIGAAVVFYIIYIAGLIAFTPTAMPYRPGGWWASGVLGALFGMVAYATYDLTNLATIKKWPLMTTIIDIIWGMVVSSVSCILTYLILQWWF